MYGKLILFGNLGKDPELRYTQGENPQPMTNISVAVHKPKREADGSWGKETIWWSIAFKGRKAENICQYLHKGSKVFVDARHPNVRFYQKNDGTQGFSLEAIGNECIFADSLAERTQQGVQQQPMNQPQAQPMQGGFEDDIPF